MSKRKPRKPRGLRTKDQPGYDNVYVYEAANYVGFHRGKWSSVRDLKKLHAWLTKAIKYLESKEGK